MTLEQLQKQAKKFEKNHKALKEKIESEVVEWKWSKKQFFSADPFYYEKNRYGAPPKLLKKAPKDPSGYVQCGFNAAGQVVMEKEIQKFPDHGWDRFFIYEENIIWETGFSKKGEIVYLRRFEVEHGLTKKCEHLHIFGSKQYRTEAFNYNASGQLISSTMHNVYYDRPGMSSLYQYRYEYNESNELINVIADIDHTYDPKPSRDFHIYKSKKQ
jgi:hypothetical protein